jgi:hypothetical protein
LRVFVRRGLLPSDDAQAMAQWEHGRGFSVDGSVRIEAAGRAGRERLLRYCTRPPFALDRLRELDPEHLLYERAKPGPGGNGPLLGPARPPCRSRPATTRPPPPLLRRAGASPLRAAVTALAPGTTTSPPAPPLEPPKSRYTVQERLQFFDAATARQRKRQGSAKLPKSKGGGWTREGSPRAMTGLVDTNVLIYRFDPRDPVKQRIARYVLRDGIEHGTLRVPH